jgi:hypothetical protein
LEQDEDALGYHVLKNDSIVKKVAKSNRELTGPGTMRPPYEGNIPSLGLFDILASTLSVVMTVCDVS